MIGNEIPCFERAVLMVKSASPPYTRYVCQKHADLLKEDGWTINTTVTKSFDSVLVVCQWGKEKK